jgi:hypothetical protein
MIWTAPLVLLVAGCGSEDCDAIGRAFSVRVELPAPDWRIDEYCLAEECVNDGVGDPGDDPHTLTVADEHNPRRYHLRVVAPDGTTVADEGNLDARDLRRDGSGCPPAVTTAVLRVNEAGTVTVRSG